MRDKIDPADLIACELDFRVVRNLPQALIESFSLVGLSKFVFIVFVGQKILWAQECTKKGEGDIHCLLPKLLRVHHKHTWIFD